MKARHLIFIVLTGMSLIAVAPTPEKARQSDKTKVVSEPDQEVKVTSEGKVEAEASRVKVQASYFRGDAERLKKE